MAGNKLVGVVNAKAKCSECTPSTQQLKPWGGFKKKQVTNFGTHSDSVLLFAVLYGKYDTGNYKACTRPSP